MPDSLSRRTLLQRAALALVACHLPGGTVADPDTERLDAWVGVLRGERLADPAVPLGHAAVRVGALAEGTPYQAGTLEAYLAAGGSPRQREPLTLSLSHFDCVTLVESSLGTARLARAAGDPTWAGFGAEVERMRYRGGARGDYTTRLHYFSEWISDGARRGLVRDLGRELGGESDARPLRFMTTHRASYPALADDATFHAIGAMERARDADSRWVVPTARIPEVADRIESGDVLAFATGIEGLDVTHTALAYRDASGRLGVLHAPLSGGEVEVVAKALPDYVAAIRRSTGILVARPL